MTLLSASFSVANAQCAAKNEAFKPGERVTYDLHFNWHFIWTKAGEATLSFNETTYKEAPAYSVDLIAAGNSTADFFFKLRDTLTSVMTPRLEPIYFRKGAVEGKRYWVDESFFSYKDGVCFVDQQRTRDGNVTRYDQYSDSRCVFDMLSILAHARSFSAESYKIGHRIEFLMTTGRRVEEQTLIYRGKKEFKADDGKVYRCLVFSFVEMKKEKEEEVITFYITDDKNHLPVRLDLFLNFGSAKAFLRSVEGSKYPLTSIVKK